MDRDRAAQEPGRAPDPVCHAEYKLEARAESERLDAEAEVYAAAVAAEHPASVELRARRRPVRLGAVLRRHLSTKLASPRIRVAMLSLGCAVFLLTALWIATSPVSVTV